MQIGILGGTGPAGSALGVRLASVGHDVIIGSRSKYRAMEVVDKLRERWPDRSLRITAGDNAAAAAAGVVVIATPWDGAYGTATSVADQLDGKVVICMANALTRMHKLPLMRTSNSAALRRGPPSNRLTPCRGRSISRCNCETWIVRRV